MGIFFGDTNKTFVTLQTLDINGLMSLFGQPNVVTEGKDVFEDFTYLQLEQLASYHPVVFSCLRLITQSVAEAPLQVVKQVDEKTYTPVSDHTFKMIVDNPSEHETYNSLISTFVSNNKLTGYGFIWARRDPESSEVVMMVPLPTHLVKIMVGKDDGRLIGYMVTYDKGKDVPVPVTDMIVLRTPDIATVFGASSAGRAALHDIQVDLKRELISVEMMRNLRIPGASLETESKLTPEARSQLRKDFDSQVGEGKRGATLILDGGLKLHRESIQMPDFTDMSDHVESRICSAFGVPPVLIGTRAGLDASTYSNYETALKSFYFTTIKPIWSQIEDSLGKFVQREYKDDSLWVKFKTDDITALHESQNEKHKRVLDLVDKQVITTEEARAMLGLDQ